MQQRNIQRGFIPIVLCVCFTLLSTAYGQFTPPGSASGSVQVNVARLAQAHVQIQPLAFGWITPGQTKSLPPNTGDFLRFMVEGEPTAKVSVTFPKTALLYSGLNSLTFTRQEVWAADAHTGAGLPPPGYWVFLPDDASIINECTLSGLAPMLQPPPNPSGKQYFWVGGKVTAGPAQPAGYYWGSYTITMSNYYM